MRRANFKFINNILLSIPSGLILIIPLLSVSVCADHETKSYTFGVVPQFDSRRIHNIWRPILDELHQRTKLSFKLRGSTGISQFEQEFKDGIFDFVYMNPYHILLANEQQGYLPLVRDVGSDLYGIVVVRKDSSIQKVEDLDGKLVAFPAPNSLGASLIPRAAFSNIFNIKIKPIYVNTHTSVYLNVALAEAEAGGGVQKSLAQQRPELRDTLRILYQSEAFAPHPVSVHPRVPVNIQQKVKNALLDMGTTPEGINLLSKIPIKKIGATVMSDYESIGKLGLESFFQE